MSSSEETYIKTASHVFVSRQATIEDPNQVQLQGKSVLREGVSVRGSVRMGRYCYVGEHTILKSPTHGDQMVVPLIIRGHSQIGKHCIIEAASIGSNVVIGDGCKIGKRCLIKDNCWVAPGTALGDDTVIPPFSRVAGAPGKVVAELPPSAATELQELAQEAYQNFASTPLAVH
jgi:dynactin 5